MFDLCRNSLLLTLETLALSLPVGTALAWLLLRTNLPGRRIGISVIVMMIFIPLYLQASAWQAGFGQEGWYSNEATGHPWITGWNAAVWVHVLAAVPWIVLLLGWGFRTIEPVLEEQALLDGSRCQVFRHVVLPASWPAVGLAAAWIAVLTGGEMTVTSIFFVRTYAEEVFNQIQLHDESAGFAGLLLPGILGSAALLAVALLCFMRLAGGDRPVSLDRSRLVDLGRWRWPLAAMLVLALAVLAGVPLGNLLYKAGVLVTQTDVGRLRTWSAVKCVATAVSAPLRCLRECGWSLLIGAAAATTATIIACPLAWTARRSRRLAAIAMVVAVACMGLPGPLVALAIVGLLNRPDLGWLVWLYDHSILAPWLALTVRALGPAVLTLWHGFRTIPQAMLDAASTDGCGPYGQFWRIVLPQRRAALAAAWLIGLAVALADLPASILTVPPGVEMLSIHVFNLVHYGVEDQVAGICLALIAVYACLATAISRLMRGREDGDRHRDG